MPELDKVLAEGGARSGGRVALGFVHAWLGFALELGFGPGYGLGEGQG